MKRLFVIVLLMLCVGCASQASHPSDWYGKDKAMHFAVSAVVAATVTNYEESHGKGPCDATRIGLSVSIALGASKELYDQQVKKTRWSWEDFTYDVLGGAVGSLVASNC